MLCELAGEGLITYMRTDGVDISPEAMHEIRTVIAQDHGPEFVPQSQRTYKYGLTVLYSILTSAMYTRGYSCFDCFARPSLHTCLCPYSHLASFVLPSMLVN